LTSVDSAEQLEFYFSCIWRRRAKYEYEERSIWNTRFCRIILQHIAFKASLCTAVNRGVLADAGFLCDIAAVFRKKINGLHYIFNLPRAVYHATFLYVPLFGVFQM